MSVSKILSPWAGILYQNPGRKRRNVLRALPGVSLTKDRSWRRTNAFNNCSGNETQEIGARNTHWWESWLWLARCNLQREGERNWVSFRMNIEIKGKTVLCVMKVEVKGSGEIFKEEATRQWGWRWLDPVIISSQGRLNLDQKEKRMDDLLL